MGQIPLEKLIIAQLVKEFLAFCNPLKAKLG
jgi:hypothetical protein